MNDDVQRPRLPLFVVSNSTVTQSTRTSSFISMKQKHAHARGIDA
jgi:hypothetical protein